MMVQVTLKEQRKNGMIGDAVVVSEGEVVVRAKGFEVSLVGDSGDFEGEDVHAAVELEWKQDINFAEDSPLIHPDKDRRGAYAILESLL